MFIPGINMNTTLHTKDSVSVVKKKSGTFLDNTKYRFAIKNMI